MLTRSLFQNDGREEVFQKFLGHDLRKQDEG